MTAMVGRESWDVDRSDTAAWLGELFVFLSYFLYEYLVYNPLSRVVEADLKIIRTDL